MRVRPLGSEDVEGGEAAALLREEEGRAVEEDGARGPTLRAAMSEFAGALAGEAALGRGGAKRCALEHGGGAGSYGMHRCGRGGVAGTSRRAYSTRLVG